VNILFVGDIFAARDAGLCVSTSAISRQRMSGTDRHQRGKRRWAWLDAQLAEELFDLGADVLTTGTTSGQARS